MEERIFLECTGFERDVHNEGKNRERHGVEPGECEEAFFNRPFIVADDERHSGQERRYFALGESDSSRRLFIAFTIRGALIRVVSVRDMSRKERIVYEKAAADDSRA